MKKSPIIDAIALSPKIADNKKIISPKMIPNTTKAAFENPDAKALEIVAKTPGPGVIANKNIAPANANIFSRVIYLPFKD
jgi:hypothetical protein